MIYKGILVKTKMSKEARRAYLIWMAQRDRCNRPGNLFFKTYGGKGIQVEYSSREFIGWWLENFPKFMGNNPDLGRIDHAKNYSLDNIIFEEHSDNVGERNFRIGNPSPPKSVLCFSRFTGELLGEFSHTREAAKQTGSNQHSVIQCCLGRLKGTRKGLTFKYSEAFK